MLIVTSPEAVCDVERVKTTGDIFKSSYESRPVTGLIFSDENYESGNEGMNMLKTLREWSREMTGMNLLLGYREQDDGDAGSISDRGYNLFLIPSGSENATELAVKAMDKNMIPALTMPLEEAMGQEDGDDVMIIADNCRDFAMFVSDYMGVDTFDTDGVTVHSYYLKDGVYEDYRVLAKQFAIDAVNGFTRLLGPLDRKEFSVVEGFNGMEYSGIVEIVGDAFYHRNPANYLEAFKNITHEIGHQWVFDIVGNYEYSEGWIDEGFVTYLTKDEILSNNCPSYDLILEKNPNSRNAEQYARDQRREIAQMASEVAGRSSYSLYGSESMVESTPFEIDPGDEVYASSGAKEYFYSRVAFAKLKSLMGDEEFYAFLHEFYNTYKWKITNTDDVLAVARKHCDDPNLETQIRFWFPESTPVSTPEPEPESEIRERLKKPTAETDDAV
jgi:hypothetical protein